MVLKGKAMSYARGRINMEVFFADNEVICQRCPFCYGEESLKRWRCRLTGELILLPFLGVGEKCPVEIEESERSE